MELHLTNIPFKFKSRIIHSFVVSVMVCVTINGFSFMITQLLESLQNQTKSHRYSKVCCLFFLNRYTSNYLYKITLDTKKKENDVKICKYVSLLFFSRMLRCICNSIVVFTTYWKFPCYCIHCLFGVNECQWLIYTHTFPFIPTWCYLIVAHTCIMFPLTQCTIHEYKTGNNVSDFTHSNWITLSYYSSPNTRVWFLNASYNSLSLLYTVI